jgi:hypothetical protein
MKNTEKHIHLQFRISIFWYVTLYWIESYVLAELAASFFRAEEYTMWENKGTYVGK